MRLRTLIPIALAALAGCGGGPAAIPSSDAARQALRASLEAWKAGQPAASLASGRPSIEPVDFEWKAGKVLSGFTIGEPSPGEGAQALSASLTIKGEPRPKEVKYMVLGIDPVRIFRDEDYNRAMNMDNAPSTTRPRR